MYPCWRGDPIIPLGSSGAANVPASWLVRVGGAAGGRRPVTSVSALVVDDKRNLDDSGIRRPERIVRVSSQEQIVSSVGQPPGVQGQVSDVL